MDKGMLMPHLFYYPPAQHCAYGFDVLAVPNEEGEVLLPPKEDFSTILSSKELPFLNSFTGHQGGFVLHHDNNRVVITYKEFPAPSLCLEAQGPIINGELHNAGTAPNAIVMYWAGLHVLRTIYQHNKIDPSFLPSIHFTRKGLEAIIPFEEAVWNAELEFFQTRAHQATQRLGLISTLGKAGTGALSSGEEKLDSLIQHCQGRFVMRINQGEKTPDTATRLLIAGTTLAQQTYHLSERR